MRPSERSTAPRTWVASYASAVRVSTMTCAASASTTTLNSARASSDGSSSTAASVASRPAAPSSLSPPASPADRSCSAAGDVRLCGAAPYACGARRAGRDAGTHQGAEGARAGGGRVKVAGRRGERGGRARRGAAAGARRLIESEAMQHARDRLRRRCARRGRERVRGAAALRQGAGAGRARCCGCTLWLGGSSRHVRRSLCVIGDASPRESSCSTPTRPRRGIRPSLKWRLSGGGRSGESRCCSDIERPSAGGRAWLLGEPWIFCIGPCARDWRDGWHPGAADAGHVGAKSFAQALRVCRAMSPRVVLGTPVVRCDAIGRMLHGYRVRGAWAVLRLFARQVPVVEAAAAERRHEL